MDKNIGFIGLGIMGNPMSKNLIKAGYNVIAWNRTESRMDDVVSAGATPAKSAADVAEQCDISITMLTDSPVVEEVVLGPNGVIEGAKPGSVLIDMSTISPSVTRMIAGRLKDKGVQMLDAPVSGSLPGAIGATLSGASYEQEPYQGGIQRYRLEPYRVPLGRRCLCRGHASEVGGRCSRAV